eukprot:PITA_35262
MAFYGLRLEYALDGSSNYIAWKNKMEAVFEDNGLKEFIDQDIPKTSASNARNLDKWNKCVARASDQRKLALKDKPQKIKMEVGNSIPNYLTKFTQCHDELGSVGIKVSEDDMVSISLIRLPNSWHSYQDFVNGWEKLLDWERLWSDLMQEKIRRNTKDGTSSKEVEEDFSLASKANKAKGKMSQGEEGGKKIDLKKFKCFHCHEHGHYARNYPQKKERKKERKSQQ